MAAEANGGTIETWLKKHHLLYAGATRHPYILSIRDGTLGFSSFKRWLAQDYVFVREFVPFVANVLIKAWRESDDKGDIEIILGGMASLNEELVWFKNESSKWGVSLSDIDIHNTNTQYCRYMESLMRPEIEYTEVITAFWAIEDVYQKSFAHCLEDEANTPETLKDACQRWGNDGFGQYCKSLQTVANRRLEKASITERQKAEVTLIKVLELEIEFWNMSRGDSA